VSFRCEKCGKVAPKGVSPVMEVIETRPKTYPNGGHGTEIVKEIKLCPECAKK